MVASKTNFTRSMAQIEEVEDSLLKLEKCVVEHKFSAYDPFDGLSSPLASFLTFNNPILRMAFQQGVRRCPINLRPLLGIKPAVSTKAMGFFAQGYLLLYQTYGRPEYLEKMKFCLQWLIDNPTKGFSGYCWGNHFNVQSRGGYAVKYAPTIVWSGFIGHAFLDAYDALGDPKYAEVAISTCEFIL